METWLILSITAIIMYGSSMVAQKISLNELSTAAMILFSLLIALPMYVVVLVALMITGEFWGIGLDYFVYGLIGATFGQMGYYTYVEAAKRGPISIVGSATASYPVMVVIVAIVFLGETMTLLQGIGVVVIMTSIIALSYLHDRLRDKSVAAKGYYVICIVTVLFWGLWAIFTKLALIGISNFAFLAIYAFVVPPITYGYYALSRIKIKDIWPKWGRAVKIAIISSIVGNLAFFVEIAAVDDGPAAIVFPLVASTPVVVVLLAFAFLKERLSIKEWLLVAGFILGIIFVSTV
jgi:drug/metabolite transporter (DMT)-like permease